MTDTYHRVKIYIACIQIIHISKIHPLETFYLLDTRYLYNKRDFQILTHLSNLRFHRCIRLNTSEKLVQNCHVYEIYTKQILRDCGELYRFLREELLHMKTLLSFPLDSIMLTQQCYLYLTELHFYVSVNLKVDNLPNRYIGIVHTLHTFMYFFVYYIISVLLIEGHMIDWHSG